MIASWTGGARSNEIVLVIAHLDSLPQAPPAPGADDNGTGSATVIAAAEIFSQYRFERTVRFVLATGEEQGVLGSDVYAASVVAAGDNVVAAISCDMLGWDGNQDGKFDLHTRLTSNPGYSNDLEIAIAFSNVVADCGLDSVLQPVIKADGLSASDHRGFWNRGIPAILAIEDWEDFTPHYHLASDALSTLNWPYFATFARASIGTLAKLAIPTDRTAFDMIEVASVPSTTGTGVGAGVWYAGHADGAGETGGDSFDAAWSNAPPNPHAEWLKILSAPYGDELSSDVRPPGSETIFFGYLVAVDANQATGVSCTNRLRFDFITPPATNRTYLARVHVDGQYTADSNTFHCVTNLHTLTAAGRHLELPELRDVSNGTAYGTCEIAERFLFPVSSNCVLDGLSMSASQAVCSAWAQCGARIHDVVEGSTNLLDPDGWVFLTAFTNDVQADDSGFDSGWCSVARPIAAERLTNSPSFFFRLKRSLLDW